MRIRNVTGRANRHHQNDNLPNSSRIDRAEWPKISVRNQRQNDNHSGGENERIMQLHPANAHYPEPGQPDEMPEIAKVTEPTLPFDETQAGDELPVDKRPLP